MLRAKIRLAILLCLGVVVLAGCGGATTRMFTKPIAETPHVTYQEWGPNRNVAVMPFVNVSKDRDAGLKCRELFITELYISGAFEDIVDEGEMLEVMRKLKIRETDALGKDTIKTLGDNLGVQALIFASVEEYTERSAKSATFAISVRMVDVETGEILWLGNASQEGGGSISEALGLSEGPVVLDIARGVIEDLIDDIASEVADRKVEGPPESETARLKKARDLAKSKPGAVPTAEAAVNGSKQAGINPTPAVKSSTPGMASTPAMGGK